MHLRSKFKDSSPCGYFESELSATDGYIFYVSQSRNTGHSLKTDPCGCYSGTELYATGEYFANAQNAHAHAEADAHDGAR